MPQQTLQQQLLEAVDAHRSGDLDQAEALYRRILKVHPRQFDALRVLGMVEYARGRQAVAERRVSEAIAANSADATAYSNRSIIRLAQANAAGAVKDADKAIALAPTFAAAYVNRANALLALGKVRDAISSYDDALVRDATVAQAWSGRSAALVRQGRYGEAADNARQAIGLNPGLADAWSNLGLALQSAGDMDGAAKHYESALAVDPDHADTLYNRGMMRHVQGRYVEALEDLLAACRRKRFDGDRGQILHTRMNVCNWDDFEAARNAQAGSILKGELVAVPFSVLTLFDDPVLSRTAARAYTAQRHPASSRVGIVGRKRRELIHVAYMSADFRDHPASYLMVDCLQAHDRTRFRITGVQIGPPDNGRMGARIRNACDAFIEAASYSDDQIAKCIEDAEVDILIDMMGHTRNARTGVLALRPAPVHVNFLGYAGTMGAPYMDYVIADKVVGHAPDSFDEQLCLLPDTYYPTSALPASEVMPTREAAGLPPDHFVFSSFCNNWNITPDVFAIWMRLLKQVDDSVLWLLANNKDVQANLRTAALANSVDPARLYFAPQVGHAEHIARQGLADLMLDTFPYGAHTTTADALWVGLPPVARSGQSFHSRVARSLLRAASLEHYATNSPREYEELALNLALNPGKLELARREFGAARTSPLFDSARYTSKLEAGFVHMIERERSGLAPHSFAVPA
jgi:predicted O-linked N-acetylglucosamine transferase (SPINDLY family)